MGNRVIKQFLYGFFYLLVLALISGGVYLWVRPAPSCFDNKLNQNEEDVDCGGPCTACAVKRLKPIRALAPQFFGLDRVVTAFLELQNPNNDYGARSFRYELIIYDRAGVVLKTVSESSFIYPAEVKTIVFPALEIDPRLIARGQVEIKDPFWEAADKFQKALVETREVVTRPEGSGVVVQGVAKNGNPFGLSRLNISAVIADNSGFLINASKTFVADLKPFEERFFKIIFSVSPGDVSRLDAKRTKVFVEVIK